jgi:uncharacterized Tic20 family protein
MDTSPPPLPGQPQPLLSIALRDGGTIDLWPDRLTGADQVIPLADVQRVRLAGDAAAPFVSLGLPGGTLAATPADPPDARRLLDAILARRPDLRTPPFAVSPEPTGYAPPPPPTGAPPPWGQYAPGGYAPPPPGYGPPPPGYGYGYYPPSAIAHPSGIPDSERILAGFCHLSVFFAPLIMPFVVWLAAKNSSPYASHQGKQAFFFHLIYGVLGAVVGMVIFFTVFAGFFGALTRSSNPGSAPFGAFAGLFLIWGLIAVISLVEIGFGIYGAVQAFQGRPFHYPLLGGI